jgi:peptidoglycan biosynthesis protein MviN/MurJ (putative lipid II flippase)
MHAQGLALAYAIAYSVGAVFALATVRKRMVHFAGRRTVAAAVRIAIAAGAMGLAVAAVVRLLGPQHGFRALIPTVAGMVVGAGVYGVLAVALQVDEINLLLDRVRHRR